jgi:3-hexulose-6-phosphate synthase
MPLLQLAFDRLPLRDALALLTQVGDYFDIIEAGTPLILREGMQAVRTFRAAMPHKTIFADLKLMDAAAWATSNALDAGADIITVLSSAADATVQVALTTAHTRGKLVVGDMIAERQKRLRAAELAAFGVDYVGVHTGIDEQAAGAAVPLADLAAALLYVHTPLVVAGGVGPTTIEPILRLNPAIIIVGAQITQAPDPLAAARAVRHACNQHAGALDAPAAMPLHYMTMGRSRTLPSLV